MRIKTNETKSIGCLDRLDYSDGMLFAAGWMFHFDEPCDTYELYLGDTRVASCSTCRRDDLENVYPSFPTAGMSGFWFQCDIPQAKNGNWEWLQIVGKFEGKRVAVFRNLFIRNFHEIPFAPEELRERVIGTKDAASYSLGALRSCGVFIEAIHNNCWPLSIQKLLDWGCGCGRLTSLLCEYFAQSNVYGCDVDPRAIQWCSKNLNSIPFSVVPLYPPTDYEDRTFDVIIGCSVLTHLSRDVQFQWLEEMQRILRPQGLLFTSVHGEFATSFAPTKVKTEVVRTGISDDMKTPELEGVAPPGYYRGVYQSKEYTMREWSKYFRIVDYIELGMPLIQDLLVLQKE
jgi:2-polyprenyl-3-methyl-5-hydroxy-6-metoxy-1,4-benzoquinol methylase